MKTRTIHRTFDAVKNLGFRNLIAGGCSFTYNISNEHSSAWPYYVRDLGGFDEVYDCSVMGAGNKQISTSVTWLLETQHFDPKDTLVMVMWSGHNRQGKISASSNSITKKTVYEYCPGIYYHMVQNNMPSIDQKRALALESYLHILNLKTYLEHHQFQFVFLEFVDYSLPNRSDSFDIADLLPTHLAKKYRSWFAPIETIYKWAIRHNMLADDDFHPNHQAHLGWSRSVLMPYLAAHLYTI